jgi:precorrin-6A/cobalt-precorrin-6A reductase
MTPLAGRRRLLILGGTAEGRALAEAVETELRDRYRAITALAGATRAPADTAGERRIGGFGGVEGLADYLRDQGIDCLVDATHPFAARISAHARSACDSTGTARLVLSRPPWPREPGDDWLEVEDIAAARAVVAARRGRIFLTTGLKDLAAFSGLPECRFLVRLVEAPEAPLPLQCCETIVARGPFGEAEEVALLRDRGIELLVSKASGGGATYAKIAAARRLGLPVIMVRRPPVEAGPSVDSVADAVAWLERRAPKS